MTPVLATQQAESVEQKFQRLATVWRTETRHLSSTTKMFSHPAYQERYRDGCWRRCRPLFSADLEKEPTIMVLLHCGP